MPFEKRYKTCALLIACAVFLLTALFLVQPVHAQTKTVPDMTHFAKIPITHQGRIKPLDSFARAQLKIFSGKTHMSDGTPALDWLAHVLFSPYEAMQQPIFLIHHPELQSMLNLTRRKGNLYSFAEFSPALEAQMPTIIKLLNVKQDQWTAAQHQLVILQKNSYAFKQLFSSLSLLLPLSFHIPADIQEHLKAETPLTYIDIMTVHDMLQEKAAKLHKEKGTDLASYTPEETYQIEMVFALEQIAKHGQDSAIFRVLPTNVTSQDWVSPWAAFTAGAISSERSEQMHLWTQLATAYKIADDTAWHTASAALYQTAAEHISPLKITLENTYNAFSPVYKTALFYTFAFLMLLASVLASQGFWLRKGAIVLLVFSAVIHLSAIIARVVILSRPPVGTLYESILFVGLICVIIGLLIAMTKKDNIGLFISSISGGLLSWLALNNIGGQNEMGVLVAVLNTNFWLTTHVLCITIGYAFCILTSLLAHARLYLNIFPQHKDHARHLFPVLHKMALLSLLFTTTGTILGGIWADQSWGRFWGWDPKENGALLIILWIMWVLHGKLAGRMSRLDVTAGLAALSVVVGLSWFGVNLLNVGLHSYGFIDAVAWGLGVFSVVEAFVILTPYIILRKRKAMKHAV